MLKAFWIIELSASNHIGFFAHSGRFAGSNGSADGDSGITGNSILRNRLITFIFLLVLQISAAPGQNRVSGQHPWERPQRIACVGNSVTFGYGLTNRDHDSYPARLQAMLGEDYLVGNFGRSGATLLSKGHNPYVKTEEYRNALEFLPDVVIIHLGLNDTDPRNWPNYRDDFMGDYQRLISSFKTESGASPRVYICLMTPIFTGHPRFRSGTRDWYWQIQEQIRQVARNTGARVIDLNAPLSKRPDLFADNLHPDAVGAEIIAQTVYAALTGDYGGFRLAPLFGEHMVFQQNKPVEIYGVANSNDTITVTFHTLTSETATGSDGRWKIILPPLPAGGPYPLQIRVNGALQVDWSDLLVGEVWLCSGQSNMEFELKGSENGPAEARNTTDAKLRFFNYRGLVRTNDIAFDSVSLNRINALDYFEGSWQSCSPETAPGFSAIGYYFGRNLRRNLDVPVGLVVVAVGGAPIESFIDRKTLEFHPVLVDVFPNRSKNDFIFEWVRQRTSKNISLSSNSLQRHPYDPGYIFEAGIAPLGRFPIQGVLWYQGESNAHHPELYRTSFTELVHSWREFWNDQQLPFFFAQLSSIDRPTWPHFRDVQRQLAEQIPHTAMVVTSDIGDSLDVHPVQKREVGERFALQALGRVYERRVVSEGPVPGKVTKTHAGLVVTFKSARKLKTSDGKPLRELEVAGTDAIFRPASGRLKGNKLIVEESGREIQTVRYGWKPFSRGNLVNEAGLPASTFLINKKKISEYERNDKIRRFDCRTVCPSERRW